MLRHIRLLIFDLDYIVFDCAQLKTLALRQSMVSLADLIPQNMPLPDARDAEAGFLEHGSRWVQRLEIGLDEENLRDLERAHRLHEDRLIAAGQGRIFPGIEEFLTNCGKAGVIMAVGADSSRDYLIDVVDRFQLDRFFQVALCAEEFGMGDVDEMLMEILRQVEVNPSESLVLGTRAQTFHAARALDIQTIACGWGIQRHAGLDQADFQARSQEELAVAIEHADKVAHHNFG